ncbi:MAG TPA: HAD family phosphatase [Vicinamibacterales bacterium]|nr:HAD family phosphatase [Vicinamibacterales bacterium]
MPRAVLWDLDGTLIDSAACHFDSWVEALRVEGVSITRRQFEEVFGWKNDRILARWLGAGAPPEQAARIADAKEALYRTLVVRRGVDPLPGAREWMARLRAAGYRQAIASSAPRLNIDCVLEALSWLGHFDAVLSGDDVRAGKPDPEIFLAAASSLSVPPRRCVVVEDAAAGIEAARRAGMRSIGVGPASAAGADLGIASLDQLPDDAFDGLVGEEGSSSRSGN